jgi:hypothetical protein
MCIKDNTRMYWSFQSQFLNQNPSTLSRVISIFRSQLSKNLIFKKNIKIFNNLECWHFSTSLLLSVSFIGYIWKKNNLIEKPPLPPRPNKIKSKLKTIKYFHFWWTKHTIKLIWLFKIFIIFIKKMVLIYVRKHWVWYELWANVWLLFMISL